MGYVRMIIALGITLLLIVKINNKINLIIPVCIIYNLALTLNDIFNAGSPIELANAFGISYQFGDTLLLIFISVLLLDILYNSYIKRNFSNVLLTIIVTLIMISLVTGALQFEFNAEWMGDLRSIGLFISGILFFARLYDKLNLKKNSKFLDYTMTVILLVSAFLWILDIVLGVHILASQYNATLSDGGSTMRFIQPYQVLSLALYSLLLVSRDIKEKGTIGLKACVYILAVILFQHRSIWLALGLGLVVIVISQCAEKKMSYKLFLQCITIVLLGGSIIIFGNGDITRNIRNSAEVFQTLVSGGSLEGTTANIRVNVWSAVMEDLSGLSLIIGRPFGYGYGHSIGWNTSPHSGFIRFLGRSGYLGILLLIILVLYIVVKFIQSKNYSLGYLVCIIAFMYGYDFTWLCGAIIGCYLGCVKKDKTKRKIYIEGGNTE